MNKHNWTNEEIAYLKSHYMDESYEVMGGSLCLSSSAVRAKCIELGCMRPAYTRKAFVWSAEQLDYLRAHYPHESAIDIADHLDYSYYTVEKKARELGLKKADDYDVRKFQFRYVRGYRDERYKNYKAA